MSGQLSRCITHVRRVAIIGAGNAGVAAARYLLAEKHFSQIDIFEQRDRLGGLWNYSPDSDREASFTIPQTNTAKASLERPIWREPPEHGKTEPTFVSPMYERLEANLPKMLMNHPDRPFPDDCQLFPSHQTCLEYLQSYADDVQHLIQFNTQICNVRPIKVTIDNTTNWEVTTKRVDSAQRQTQIYDAVVIASGQFNVSYIPDIEGVAQWHETLPGTMTHSKYFRRPEDYTGKKTITIGRGPSGLDMASQIALYCQKPLLISTRTPEDVGIAGSYQQRPNIIRFEPDTRTVHFADGSSESGIDSVLFCTGYLYSYPFLSRTALEEVFPNSPINTLDGLRPRNLYKYIFFNADPTLAFISVQRNIVPFPMADTQSAAIARVWSGRLAVPSHEEMEQWEAERIEERGDGRDFLSMKPPEDGLYINEVAAWVDTAKDGVSEKTFLVHGKPPARWTEKDLWIRQQIKAMRKTYSALGEARHAVKTLEELGFDYEKKR